MTTTSPTVAQLTHAVKIAESIAALEAELAAILGNSPTVNALTSDSVKADGRKGKRSAATIAKMKASQKKRWAKLKGTKASAAVKPPASTPKKADGFSKGHKAKLAAAAKARWAAIRAGKLPNPFGKKK